MLMVTTNSISVKPTALFPYWRVWHRFICISPV
jgi:hypothetical protein